jgi:hypothetical protein
VTVQRDLSYRVQNTKQLILAAQNATKKEKDCVLKTNETYRNRTFPGHQHIDFIHKLKTVGVGMVSQIPLEPMHLIDMGMMKKFLVLYVNNKDNECFESKKLLQETETILLKKICSSRIWSWVEIFF